MKNTKNTVSQDFFKDTFLARCSAQNIIGGAQKYLLYGGIASVAAAVNEEDLFSQTIWSDGKGGEYLELAQGKFAFPIPNSQNELVFMGFEHNRLQLKCGDFQIGINNIDNYNDELKKHWLIYNCIYKNQDGDLLIATCKRDFGNGNNILFVFPSNQNIGLDIIPRYYHIDNNVIAYLGYEAKVKVLQSEEEFFAIATKIQNTI